MTGAAGTTPVVVGVGQASDPLDSPDYRCWSPVDLAAAATARAIEDSAGRVAGVTGAIDVVAGIRPFDQSGPGGPGLGTATNFPRAVARRAGLDPPHAVLEVVGGQSPQALVNEFADRIGRGELAGALIAGGEALSTQAHYLGRDDRPDFSDTTGGQLEDRGPDWEYYLDDNLLAHELFSAPAAYALVDTARRAELGIDAGEYRHAIGDLFAPFTRVAVANPLAAVRRAYTAGELAAPTPDNRLVWEPYTRRTIAREKVNLGAALLLMSEESAHRAGVPREKWVYLHGHADTCDIPLLEREWLGRGDGAVEAARVALEAADITVDELTTLDLYSCFAAPVFALCDGLGLAVDDPRGLTVTGGLPFFGGPGNAYSTHAIAETVHALRRGDDGFGLVGANGGILNKYSVGVYSPRPRPWREVDSRPAQERIDAAPRLPVVRHAEGPARIETFTVHHGRSGPDRGIVVGTLNHTGQRFVAAMSADLLDRAAGADQVGAQVHVRPDGARNVAGPGS